MKKLVLGVLAAAVAALSLAAFSSAAPRKTTWETTLTASAEVPKQAVKNTKGHGTFTGTLVGNKLSWTLTFTGLTGAATAAHIHMAAAGKAGNVVVVLCASACKSGKKGTATISKALQTAFAKHLLYVNVHTAKNPNGEIRGQLASM